MKIGKATVAESAICTSDDETIVVRGHDLCRDLIGKLSFTDYFWLLVTGQRPSPLASRVLIMLTDGVNNAGAVSPEQAGELAAELRSLFKLAGLHYGLGRLDGEAAGKHRALSRQAGCSPGACRLLQGGLKWPARTALGGHI